MKQKNGFPVRNLDRFDLEAARDGNAIRRLKSCFAKDEKAKARIDAAIRSNQTLAKQDRMT